MITTSKIPKRKGRKLWKKINTLILVVAMVVMNLPLSALVSASDSYGITLNPSSGLVTTEGGGTDTFTVQLNSKPSNTVTVNLASSDTTEGTVSPTSVTFTADRDWDSQSRLPTGVPSTIGNNVNPSGTWVSYPIANSLSQCVGQLPSWPMVDSDWITGQTAAGGYILFSFDHFTIPDAATNIRLTVYFRARDNGEVTGTNSIGACLGMGGGNIMYATTTSNPGSSFGLGGYSWDNNPMTGFAWTADQINGYATGYSLLQFGVYSNDLDPNIDVSCVSAQVSYDYFTPSNWNIPQTITVTGVNDAIDDGDVAYTINATTSSPDQNFHGKTASSSVTNRDNDITVSFDANGGSPTPASQAITTGGKVVQPSDPTKSDYTFDGWYTDNNTFANRWDFNVHTVGTSNFILYAKWRANNPVPTLTGISPSSGYLGQTLNVTLTGTGFIEGVSTVNGDSGIAVNSATVNSSTQITANLTIAAGATPGIRHFSVTNAAPGGGTSGSQAFEILSAATLTINQTSVDGYSSVSVSPSATVKVDVRATLTGLNWSSTQYQIEGQDAVNVDTANFTADGLPHNANFNITVPVTPGTYDLTLIAYEGEGCIGGHSNSFTLTDAIHVGIFGDSFGTVYANPLPGWMDGDMTSTNSVVDTATGSVSGGSSNGYLKMRNVVASKTGISTLGSDNIHLQYTWGQEGYYMTSGSLTVAWKISSSSTWNIVNTHNFIVANTSPYANSVDAVLTGAGNSIIDIRITASNIAWNEWARVDNVLVTGTPLTIYTVAFDAQGGSPTPDNQMIFDGGYITEPQVPSKEGYTLSGWYADSPDTLWNFASDRVTSDMTLYAKWTINQYTVTFDSQGGSAVASQTIDHGGTVNRPADPVRSGYTFAGWYKDAACTDDWVFVSDAVTSNITLYARWAVLDQFLNSTGTSYLIYDEIVAQTFTAGMTGDLYKVSCHLRNTQAITLTAQIQGLTTDGLPNGTVLASSTINVAAVPAYGGSRWVDNAFAEPLSITAGERYAIVWSGLSYGVTNMEVSNTDSYPGGKAIKKFYGSWLDYLAPDFIFRTFVLSSPGITVTPSTDLTTTESGGFDTFTVVLNTQPAADVAIGLSSSDTTEGTVSSPSLTFTASNWNSPQTITITGVDDALDDGDISYTITGTATSADAHYNGKTFISNVANLDNDITVSFHANGGSPTPTDQVIATGNKVASPTDPTRSDYTLDGWYTDDSTFANQWDFDVDTVGASNFTLYAKWVVSSQAPIVTEDPEDQSITYGNNASFTASASGNPTPTVQWQLSMDGGNSFSNISDGGVYSGASTMNLIVTNPSVSYSGYQYRAVFTNGVGQDAISGVATLRVTPLGITGSFTAANKVYDGNTSAVIVERSLTGTLANDDVSLTGGTAAFGDSSVGENKIVCLTGATLSGTDADNYSLISVATTTAGITACPITVKADGKTKVYGETDPALTYQITSGVLVGEDSFTGALTRVVGEDVGPYAIQQGTLALSSNYALTYEGADFSITPAVVKILYNGDQIVKLGDTFVTKAQLIGSNSMSITNIKVCFFIEDEGGERKLGEGSTDGSGFVTLAAIDTDNWASGVYTIIARTCDANVTIAEDEATFTVADPGDTATGGGWYTLSGSGRVNFGFTVRKVPDTDPIQYKGQILLINNEKWRLKGELHDYIAVNNEGAASGTGKLYRWDADLNEGLGDWVMVDDKVSFTISFVDNAGGGTVKKIKITTPDSFGIHIDYIIGVDEPILPNSSPTSLKGGNIDMKYTDDVDGGDTGKTPPGKSKIK